MTLEQLNKICQNTLISHLEIEFTGFDETYVEATMPIDTNKHQPMGVMHGGASLALAETVASAGAMLSIDFTKYDVYGLQVSANHISTKKDGIVYARAEVVHKGSKTQVWDVKISDEEGKLISTARVTNIIIEKQ